MNYDYLSPEIKEKARACKTAEDVLALVKEEGIELNDAELESISGGMQWLSTDPCPCDWDDWDEIGD